MKKILLMTGAVALMLGAASCSNEIDEPVISGDGNVHFTVKLPEQMRTRAISDGTTASTLTYAVYDNATGELVTLSEDKVNFDPTTLTATVDLNLVNGKTYDLVFWADAPGNTFYTFDSTSKSINVSYTDLTNSDESRDAFFASESFEVTGPVNKTIELRRPFAQINLGTDDMTSDAVKNAYKSGLGVSLKTTAYTTLNLATGEVSGETEVTFTNAPATKTSGEAFPYNPDPTQPNPYTWISMDYILTSAEKDVIDTEFTFYNGTVANAQTLPVSNVPVQRNYRTNIYGSLLTSPANLQIIIKPEFEEPDYNVDVTSVSTAEQAAAAVAKGGTVKVSAPIDVIDLTASTPAKPLTLQINSPVGQIKLGTTEAAPQQTTIVVAKDVAYPEFVVPGNNGAIRNVTIKGDVTSSQKLNGFSTSNKGVKNVEGLTFDNVAFEGLGVNLGYSANPQIVTDVTIKDCVFTELTQPVFTLSGNNYAGQTMGDITITGNTATFAANAASNANGINIWYLNTGKVTVANNSITGAAYHGVQIASCSVPVSVTDNTIVNAHHDGIKLDSNTASVTATGNSVQALENGIRVKNFPASNTVTLTGNTVDMTKTIPFNNGEPWGILVIGNNTASVINLTVSGNTKVGTNDHWFEVTGVTTSESSNYANPWVN